MPDLVIGGISDVSTSGYINRSDADLSPDAFCSMLLSVIFCFYSKNLLVLF